MAFEVIPRSTESYRYSTTIPQISVSTDGKRLSSSTATAERSIGSAIETKQTNNLSPVAVSTSSTVGTSGRNSSIQLPLETSAFTESGKQNGSNPEIVVGIVVGGVASGVAYMLLVYFVAKCILNQKHKSSHKSKKLKISKPDYYASTSLGRL